jgi:hypothetical protein
VPYIFATIRAGQLKSVSSGVPTTRKEYVDHEHLRKITGLPCKIRQIGIEKDWAEQFL